MRSHFFRGLRFTVTVLGLSAAFSSFARAQVFRALEGCSTLAWPAPPYVEAKSLKKFDSCDEEGPPKYNNYCCSGLPDCLPGDCCGCDKGDKAPGWQPDGSFHRTSGLDCDLGLIQSRTNFRGSVSKVEWRGTTEMDDWDGDFTFNMQPLDATSTNMMVQANMPDGMHIETPFMWVPRSMFYLQPGDRVDAFGDWVEDCDHSPKQAEIHPAYGMAISRLLSCADGLEQSIGQVFYTGYGPAAIQPATLRIYAPPHPANDPGATLHYAEFLVVQRDVSWSFRVNPTADQPNVEVTIVQNEARPGKSPGQCVSDDPSLDQSVLGMEMSYHSLVSVWWEPGTSKEGKRVDLVPTLEAPCKGTFVVRNRGFVPTPPTIAVFKGPSGTHIVPVPGLAPGQSVELSTGTGECEGKVIVTVDPNHRIAGEDPSNNTVVGDCIC